MSQNKGILAACIVAALALSITIAGTATASPGASKAGKRCKKKHSAKRKCKKRKADARPSPLIRATLTCANGNRAGNGSNTIPLSSMTPDFSGPGGSETFTDNLFTPQAARDLSFGVCYTVGGSVHTPFTITYVTADGVVHGDSQNPGSSFHYDYPGEAPIPSGYCAN